MPNFKNRTLFESDNLPVLLGMDSGSVDLIATDPPFKKDRKFQGIGPSEGQTMKDTWSWHGDPPGSPGETKKSDIHKEWLDHTREHWPALNEVIEAAYTAHSPSMAAFLAFMSVRLIEMHRILKPTGSLYLHCDPTASHYLKAMLDGIFGAKNFRNEIVWHYYNVASVARRHLGRKHDIIFWYSRSNEAIFHWDEMREAYSPDSNWVKSSESYGDDRYKPDKRGKLMHDVWRLPTINNMAKERTGWTTQKPLRLYSRIVKASSNEGDMVLDPFCGCATTCVAAEQLDRQWVGIDQSPKAKTIVKDRLEKEVRKSMAWSENVTISFDAPVRSDVHGLTPPTFSLPPAPKSRRRGRRKQSGAPSYDRNEMRVHLALRDGACCQGCGMTPPTMPGSLSPELEYLDIDHIKPRADAGGDNEKNLCLLCPPCNRRKAHIWTLAQLRQANQRTKKMLDKSKLKKELENV